MKHFQNVRALLAFFTFLQKIFSKCKSIFLLLLAFTEYDNLSLKKRLKTFFKKRGKQYEI